MRAWSDNGEKYLLQQIPLMEGDVVDEVALLGHIYGRTGRKAEAMKRLAQLDDNLAALEFTLPEELKARLDKVSALPAAFPYSFFTPGMQAMLAGSHVVGDKPARYFSGARVEAADQGA